MTEQDEHLWEVHKLACEWVRFADSKASIILTAQGVMASFTIPAIMPQAHFIMHHWQIATPMLLSVLSASVSCAFGILAITPRLKMSAPDSNIYFGHIATKHNNPTTFASAISTMLGDPARIQSELSTQIWANCKVAWKKYNNTWWAVVLLALALVLATIAAGTNFYYLSKIAVTGG